jgi:serine/threonine protein kinase
MKDAKLRNALKPGHTLHWYRVLRVLGQGGFGITYLARDGNLEQDVAIKEYLPMELAVREGDHSVYPASEAQDDRYQWGLARFLAEARTLAKFRHPAIVRVLSVFEANNTAYMVMEYQHGQSLQHAIERRRTLAERELLQLLGPLLDGLEVMHAQGFIHRDIKPPNIFLRDDGQPVLLDFGSARQALGAETRSLTSVVSPGYAPFEQYYSKGDRQGPWTDIYGLGATVYRCLSGVQPMAAIDRSEAILKAERDVFVSARELGQGKYSARFLAAIDHALAFNEKQRPQSIADWRAELGIVPSDSSAPTVRVEVDAATTRFSALTDELLDSGHERVVNPGARAEREATRALRDPMQRRKPRATRAARRGLWLALVAVIAAAGGLSAYRAGWLPDIEVTSRDDRAMRDLIAQGDRALAAGQVFEPAAGSALTSYLDAHRQAPADRAAAHGLGLVGDKLAQAASAAVRAGDLARAEQLLAHLDTIPAGIYNAAGVRGQLVAAQAAVRERQARAARVEGHLNAAHAALDTDALTAAAIESARASLHAAQDLEPDNARAAEGLRSLLERVTQTAQAALAGGRHADAAGFLEQAQAIDRDAPGLTELATAVTAARETAARAAAESVRVEELLAAAKADFDAGRVTAPAGRNALERYRTVQQIAPADGRAQRGLEQVHDRALEQAAAAFVARDYALAATLVRRSREAMPRSARAGELMTRIDAAREQEALAYAEAQRAAAARAVEAEQARLAAEQAATEAERRRRQDAEAMRLLTEARRQAAEAEQARLTGPQADAARPRVVLDFVGFEPKYASYFVTPQRVQQSVVPLLQQAGYEVVGREAAQITGVASTQLKLLIFRLTVNENTATGLYSYAGSLNVFPDDALGLDPRAALNTRPTWTQGYNGLGPPSDLRWMLDHYARMTSAFVAEIRPAP